MSFLLKGRVRIYDHEAGGMETVRMREKEEGVLVQLGLPRGHNYIFEE